MVWKLKTGAIYGCIFSHSQLGFYSFLKKKCFPFNLFVSVLNQLTLITEMESLCVFSCVVKEIKTPRFSVTMLSSEQPRSLNPLANLNNDLQWSETCTVNQPAFLATITEPRHMGLSKTPTNDKQKPWLFENKGTLIAGLVTPAISSQSSVQIILS